MKKILEGMQITKQNYVEEKLQIMKEVGINESEIKRQLVLQEGFLVITHQKIIQFLCAEIRRRNPERANKLHITDTTFDKDKISVYASHIDGWQNPSWRIIWKEYGLEEISHDKVPPIHLLKRLQVLQEKKIFDYFVVATVIYEEIKLDDPFLLGRLNGMSERFFIGQWGDEINIDNII